MSHPKPSLSIILMVNAQPSQRHYANSSTAWALFHFVTPTHSWRAHFHFAASTHLWCVHYYNLWCWHTCMYRMLQCANATKHIVSFCDMMHMHVHPTLSAMVTLETCTLFQLVTLSHLSLTLLHSVTDLWRAISYILWQWHTYDVHTVPVTLSHLHAALFCEIRPLAMCTLL